MPKIPVYSAEGAQVRARSPDVIHVPTQSDIGAGIVNLAESVGRIIGYDATVQQRIQEKLQKQQNDLDIAKLNDLWNAGVANIRTDLTQDINYAAHEKTLIERGTRLSEDLLGQATNNDVSMSVQRHIAGTFPMYAAHVRADANKLWLQQQKADLQTQGDVSAENAIAAPLTYDPTVNTATDKPFGFDNTMRNMEINTHHKLVDEWFARGAISAAERYIYKKNYDEKVLKGSMTRLQEEGKLDSAKRDQLFDLNLKGAWNDLHVTERLKILNQANVDARTEQIHNDQALTKTQATALDVARSRALNSALTESELEDIKNKKNFLIDASHYPQLKDWNENPPGNKGNQEAAVVMNDYASGSRELSRIRDARNQLNIIQQTLDRANPYITKELERLQTHEENIKTQNRIGLHEDLKFANDSFDAMVPAPRMFELPGQKNMRDADIKRRRHEMDASIRSGTNVEDALKKYREYIDNKYNRRIQIPSPGVNVPAGGGGGGGRSTPSDLVEDLLR
jgi:hypothetical protein